MEVKDTPQTRAYLISVAQRGKGIIATTRYKYNLNKTKLPLFLADFDARYDAVIEKFMSGHPHAKSETSSGGLTLVSLQRPQRQDSADAVSKPAQLDAPLRELTTILLDKVVGFARISTEDKVHFSWSLKSITNGAAIYVSCPSEPKERMLAERTDINEKSLEYALWNFRVDWGNCSETQTHDPFLENPMKLEFSKVRCKK